jgi:hypothetical protein
MLKLCFLNPNFACLSPPVRHLTPNSTFPSQIACCFRVLIVPIIGQSSQLVPELWIRSVRTR